MLLLIIDSYVVNTTRKTLSSKHPLWYFCRIFVVNRPFSLLSNSILSFFGGLERFYKVVLFDLVQQKRYTSSKYLVVVTQVCPSFLPDLIDMTPSTIAPWDTQMPGSITCQHTFATSFHLSDDDTAADDVDDDDDATVITTNSKVPYEITEYNIKLLMTNEVDISVPALQQATMAVSGLCYPSSERTLTVCIMDLYHWYGSMKMFCQQVH
jgi:hypothetical protein